MGFRRGHNNNYKLSIIIPRGISETEFEAAAAYLGLIDEWGLMKSECVHYFDSYETLVSAFRQAKSRHSSTANNMTSLLLIGHGGYDRCHVLYGAPRPGGILKRPSNLMAQKISGLIDVCRAKIVHLMTCKAAKLMVSMTQTKRALLNVLHNDETVFIAYGSEDITTVPLEFASGKSIAYASNCVD